MLSDLEVIFSNCKITNKKVNSKRALKCRLPWSLRNFTYTRDEKDLMIDFITHAQYRGEPIVYYENKHWHFNIIVFSQLKREFEAEYDRLYNS